MRGIRTEKLNNSLKRHHHGYTKQNILKNYKNSLLRLVNLRETAHNHNNNNRVGLEKQQAMSIQLDHMYLEYLDAKPSLGKEVEAKHLKELVLLHLDLIQQQAEEIAVKDKIIKELKAQNESLRARLDRADKKLPAGCPKVPTSVHISTNTSPIKSEIKEEEVRYTNNNNNENVCTQSTNSAGSQNFQAERHHSSQLRSGQHRPPSSANSRRGSEYDQRPPAHVSGVVCAGSPGRILRNSSPLLRNKNENIESCGSKSPCNVEITFPLRHSPRLDTVNSNIGDSEIYVSDKIRDDITGLSSMGVAPKSDCDFDKHITPRKSFNNKSPNKKHSPKDRKITRADALICEQDNIVLKSRSQSPVEHLITRQVSGANKRKSDSQLSSEDEPEIKKNRRTADDDIVMQQSVVTPDYDSDGTTNHSLRSRDKQRDSTGISDGDSESSSESKTPLAELDENLEPAPTAKDYEQYFIQSASEAAAKLREQNARVPGCSIRSVRSAEGVLCTDQHYYLPTDPPADLIEPSEATTETEPNVSDFTHKTQVEIPSWRPSVLTSLYVLEGTENLEDEIFTKRHNKLEHDEKRRKRWDLQRLREQRQYEKLKERYEVRNSASNTSSSVDGESSSTCGNALCSLHQSGSGAASCGAGSGGSSSGVSCGGGSGVSEILSLWPDPKNALFLEVVEKVPVCAFGQPFAVTPSSEFSLPWLTRSSGGAGGSTHGTSESLTRRRRR